MRSSTVGAPRIAWVLLAAILVASGSVALVLRSAANRDGVRAFDVRATDIGSNVSIALKRIDDASVAFAALVTAEHATLRNAQLADYFAGIGRDGRYPGLLGFSFIRYVSHRQLASFGTQLRSDPYPGGPRGPLRVFPAGNRSAYCLVQLSASPALQHTSLAKLAPGGAVIDVCAVPGSGALSATRDSGQLNALVLDLAPYGPVLNLTVPVYRSSTVPSSTAARRAQLEGWALAQFSIHTVLGAAIGDHAGTSLEVDRRDVIQSHGPSGFGPISAVAALGPSPTTLPLHHTFIVRADGLWLVTVSGRPTPTGMAPGAQAGMTFGAGTLIGLLVFALVCLLSRNRARSEDRLRVILKNSPVAIFIRDRNRRYTATNDAFDQIMQLPPGAAIGMSMSELLPAELAAATLESDTRVLAGETVTEPLRVPHENGERVITMTKFPLVDDRGEVNAVCGVFTDVTEQQKTEAQLQWLADHDALTGTFNRGRLIRELAVHLRNAARTLSGGAVLTFDIDHLKVANDTYGHAVGDAMLMTLAETLSAEVRSGDIVARLGGDEFTVVLPEACIEEAVAFADAVRRSFAEPESVPSRSVSVGIAGFDGSRRLTPDEILVSADMALYDAKLSGGDRATLFTGQSSGALRWVQRIRAALNEGRFVLYGQPIFDLGSGGITHHELLIRMLPEDGGELISPAEFLPVAERFGLINEIDLWVTQTGLELALDNGGITINLSGHSIGQESIIAAVRNAIVKGLDPSKVIFEITETAALTHIDAARAFAQSLAGLGCDVALDDFGTGFSSFNYVKHIPAAYVKIDMEFVRDLASSESDQEIVKSIVQIAHAHGMRTIAEGVECAEALELLKALGADCAQGFHLGKPRRVSPPTAAEGSELIDMQRAMSRSSFA